MKVKKIIFATVLLSACFTQKATSETNLKEVRTHDKPFKRAACKQLLRSGGVEINVEKILTKNGAETIIIGTYKDKEVKKNVLVDNRVYQLLDAESVTDLKNKFNKRDYNIISRFESKSRTSYCVYEKKDGSEVLARAFLAVNLNQDSAPVKAQPVKTHLDVASVKNVKMQASDCTQLMNEVKNGQSEIEVKTLISGSVENGTDEEVSVRDDPNIKSINSTLKIGKTLIQLANNTRLGDIKSQDNFKYLTFKDSDFGYCLVRDENGKSVARLFEHAE